MLEHLRRFRPLFRVVAKHPLHEADGFGGGPRDYGLQVHFLVLWKREKLSVGKTTSVRPVIRIGRAEDHRDLLKLIHL